MTLLEEYKNQNIWREWERYLDRLPLKSEDTIYDLGCSIGAVTKLIAPKVKKVIGIDNDRVLLDEANKHKPENCEFIAEDISDPSLGKSERCDGIWTSFTLAYMKEPYSFISNWMKYLNHGGWFAIVDVDGLFSNHLSSDNKYYNEIDLFEKVSEQSKIYDFRIGRKIRNLMEQNGLKLVVDENDWYDRELNFKGSAAPNIAQNWKGRLERMVSLKTHFRFEYSDFCDNFLDTISREDHTTNGGVRYYVGIKTKLDI